jgi:hypothetical protein
MKKIIVLNKSQIQNYMEVGYVFWLEITSSRQILYANSDATSVYKSASIEEINLLKSGSVTEVVGTYSCPIETSLVQIANYLSGAYSGSQVSIKDKEDYKFYGTYWGDGDWHLLGL